MPGYLLEPLSHLWKPNGEYSVSMRKKHAEFTDLFFKDEYIPDALQCISMVETAAYEHYNVLSSFEARYKRCYCTFEHGEKRESNDFRTTGLEATFKSLKHGIDSKKVGSCPELEYDTSIHCQANQRITGENLLAILGLIVYLIVLTGQTQRVKRLLLCNY